MKRKACIQRLSAAVFSIALAAPALPAFGQDASPEAAPPGRHGMKHGMMAGGMGMGQGGGMMPPMMRRGGMMHGEGMMQGGGMHRGGGPGGPHGGAPGEGDFRCWQEALDLTDEQLSSLKGIYRAMRKEHILERAKVAAAEVDLEELLDGDTLDLGRIEKIVKESESSRTKLRMGHIRAWDKARGLLTEEQRGRVETLKLNLSPRHHGPCGLQAEEGDGGDGEGTVGKPPAGAPPPEHRM